MIKLGSCMSDIDVGLAMILKSLAAEIVSPTVVLWLPLVRSRDGQIVRTGRRGARYGDRQRWRIVQN